MTVNKNPALSVAPLFLEGSDATLTASDIREIFLDILAKERDAKRCLGVETSAGICLEFQAILWAVGCKLNSVDLQLLVYRLFEDRTPCGIDSYAAASTFWFRALGRLLARHASEHDYVADVFSAQEMLLKLGSDYLQYFPDIKQSWLDVDDVNEEQLHHVNALNQIKKLCALSCVVRTREHLTSTQEALFYTASLAISYLFEDDEDSGLSYFLIDTLVESFHEIRTS